MANEFIARNGLIAQNNSTVSGSLTVTAGITGSIFGSASYATTAATASYANNFTVAGTLTAQTLVVQTITSSIIYSSGSNIFGNALANTQTFTGSMYQTGSVAAFMGNVGIGTASPGAKLHVEGGNTILNNGLGDTILYLETDTSGLYDPVFQMGSGQNTITSEGFEIWYSNNVGDVHLSTTYNDPASSIRFHTATGASKSTSNERMIISGIGNVGIGTTNPGYKLDVQSGSVNFRYDQPSATSYTYFRNWATGGSVALLLGNNDSDDSSAEIILSNNALYLQAYGDPGSSIQFGTRNSSTSAVRMKIDQDGNVGIGLTNPSARLSLGSATNGERITWDNSSNVFSEYSSGDLWLSANFYGNLGVGGYKTSVTAAYGAAGISVSSTGAGLNGVLKFFVDNAASKTAGDAFTPTERMRITGAGNVGIGTTNPNNTLQVVGGVTATSFTGSFSGSLSAPGSTTQVLYNNGGAIAGDSGLVYSGSNVGIGITNPSYKLQVAGDIYSSGVIRIEGTSPLYFNSYGGGWFMSDSTWIRGYGGKSLWMDSGYIGGDGGLTIGYGGSTPPSKGAIISGSVGIGLTNPTGKLDISTLAAGGALSLVLRTSDSGTANGTIRWKNNVDANQAGIGSNYNVTDAGALEFLNGNTTNMVLRSSGRLGIGTPTPGYQLAISNAGAAGIELGASNGNYGEMYSYNRSTSAYIQLRLNGSTIVLNDATGGNVGIGTTSPSNTLQVVGGVTATSFTGSFSGSAAAPGSTTQVLYNNGGAIAASSNFVFSGSNVGIGTTNPLNKLVVTSDATYNNENSYAIASAAASDPAYKTIIGYDYANDIGVIAAVRTSIGWKNISIPQGSVGIGTIAPQGKLSIDGGDIRFNYGNAAANHYIYFNHNSSYDGGLLWARNNSLDWQMVNATNGDFWMYSYGTSTVAFTLQKSSGNVGIGSSSPASILNTSGAGQGITHDDSTAGKGYIRFRNSSTQLALFGIAGSWEGSSLQDTMIAAETGLNIRFYTNGSATPKMFISGSGNVGIGTTNPGSKLHVAGASGVDAFGLFSGGAGGTKGGVYLGNDGAQYGSLWFDNSNNDVALRQNYSTGNLTFGTNSTEKVRITSAGDVLVGGTTSTWAATNRGVLQVNGVSDALLGLTIGSSAKAYYYHDGSNLVMYNYTGNTYLANSSGNILSISGANVGIGTTNPLSKLYVEGGSADWSLPTPGTAVGTVHLDPGVATDNFGNAITFGASDSSAGSTAMAGIYVRTDGSYGSKMYFGTTDSYAAGSKVAVTIDESQRVGIGTTGPGGQLDVYTNGYKRLWITYPSTYATTLNIGIDSYISYDAGSATLGINGGDATYGNIIFSSGTERMRIAAGGNVGIGTTNPGVKLEVNGNIKLSSTVGATATPSYIWLGNDYSNGVTRDKLKIYLYNSGTEQYGFTVGSNADVQYHSNVLHDFYTANSLSLRINGSGNVGIGTTSPSGRLHVYQSAATDTYLESGTSGTTGKLYFKTSDNSDLNKYIMQEDYYMVFGGHANEGFKFRDSASNVLMSVYGSNNAYGSRVGIGTAAPSQRLDVAGQAAIGSGAQAIVGTDGTYGGYSTIGFGGTTNGYNRVFGNAGTADGLYLAAATGRGIQFWTNGTTTTRMIITESGNVGIATSSPQALLDVGGGDGTPAGTQFTAVIKGTSTRTLYFDGGGSSGASVWWGDGNSPQFAIDSFSGGGASFWTNDGSWSERMRILSGGNVGIGTTNPTQGKLVVNGGVYATSFTGSFSGTIAAPGSNTQVMYNNSGVIAGSSNLTFDGSTLNVTGTLTATVKSFIIDHPTKADKKLQYGVLEGPEHSVYIRGKLKNTKYITLPDYWHSLVHEDSITVNITAIGGNQDIWVEQVTENEITVGYEGDTVEYFYTVFAERKDVDKLITEFDKEI